MLNTTILGRYEVKKQVREDDLFVEYWGEDTKMGRDVTLSVVRAVSAADFFSRFEPVNRKFASLHSSHLPALVELCELNGRAVIIRQHIDGQTLRGMLDMGQNLPLELVLDLAQQLGEYLDLLHQAGLLQFTFELEDVLIAEGAAAYVTNFGIAQGVDLGALLAADKIQARTSFAPELVKGGKADERADFYSAGALLFEALTGKKPSIRLESERTVAAEDLHPSRLRMGVSPEWDALISRCLNPNPAKRIQSAAEFLNQVDEIRRSMNTVPGSSPLGMEDSLVGQTLGPYRLVSRLGQGGMATVYKAYEPALDRYVAVKVLPQFFASDPVFVQRFRREAKAVAQLNHPNIVPIYSYGETNGITYIAMQFVVGDTLKHEGQKFAFEESLRLLAPIARALGYAHQRGVVHRDVKPSNILIAEDGNWPLLADFGLAQMAQVSGKLTESGVGMGTPMYMSPEQGQGEKVDHRTDIYSLGIVLYEMVTGDVPFRADTPMAIVIKHISAPMPMPSKVNPEAPDFLEAIILKATAKNPEDRYQTAEEMAQAMENALARLVSGKAPARVSSIQTVVPPAPETKAQTAPKVKAEPATQTASVVVLKGIGSFLKGFYRFILFLIILGLCLPVSALIGMAIFDICPPQGPWAQPPWCEGTPYQFNFEGTAPPMPAPPAMQDLQFGAVLFQDDFEGGVSPRWQFTCDPNTTPWIADEFEGRTIFRALPPAPPGNVSCAEIRNTDWQDYAIELDFRFLKPDQFDAHYFALRGRLAYCPPTIRAAQEYVVVVSPDMTMLQKERCAEGSRRELLSTDADFDLDGWHRLQYILVGNRARVLIDGRTYIDYADEEDPLRGGDLWLDIGPEAEVLFDNLKVYEVTPAFGDVAPKMDLMLDDFEGETYWGASFDEETSAKLECRVDESRAFGSSNYLSFDFDVPAGSWGTCGLDYDDPQDWGAYQGVAFDLRADQSNMPYEVIFFDDKDGMYVYQTRVPLSGVGNWERVEVPWHKVVRVEWQENPGMPIDPARVQSFRLQIVAGEANQTGRLWVDNLRLLGSYAPADPAADLFFDDFENPAWTKIESYADEEKDNQISCSLSEPIGQQSAFALKFDFDLAPESWASCGFPFDAARDWRSGKGVSFRMRSSSPNLASFTYYVSVVTGVDGGEQNYLYEAVTSLDTVSGWRQVEIPWHNFLRAGWQENAGAPLDPFHVTGLWFDVDSPADGRAKGTLWIDDVRVIP